MNINFSRIISIARKEVRHILRDPFTLAFALGLPVLLLINFGYIIDLNYDDIGMKVQDLDNSRVSRDFTRSFSSSGYFRLEPFAAQIPAASWLDGDKTFGVMIIKEHFGRKIRSGEQGDMQLLLDGSDSGKTGVVMSYVSAIMESENAKLSDAPPKGLHPPAIRTRFLFNPELNSHWFVVPGLATVIIGLMCVLLTALTVAREWENGSMELLLSTPVHPLEIVIGKLAPYFLLTLFDTVMVYFLARLLFGVPFTGSMAVYWVSCCIFILAALSQGLVISVIARQQQIAMQMSMMSGLLPSFLLSGFMFPIESMPVFFRWFTAILAPRWFMEISRGVFLRGDGFAQVLLPLGALGALAALLITVAVRRFKTDIEP
jgi:ABC-2 type transport system permease protein